MHECQQDSDLLAISLGEILDAAIEIEVESLCKVVGVDGVRQVPSPSHPIKLVTDSHASDQGEVARQIADVAMNDQAVTVGIESEQPGRAGCRVLEVEE